MSERTVLIDHVSSNFLFIVAQQNILEINVSWCHLITENGIEALARGCNKIRKFSSKGWYQRHVIVELRFITTLFSALSRVGCKKVNDAALNALANFCPGIEVLNLHSCDVSLMSSARLSA